MEFNIKFLLDSTFQTCNSDCLTQLYPLKFWHALVSGAHWLRLAASVFIISSIGPANLTVHNDILWCHTTCHIQLLHNMLYLMLNWYIPSQTTRWDHLLSASLEMGNLIKIFYKEGMSWYITSNIKLLYSMLPMMFRVNSYMPQPAARTQKNLWRIPGLYLFLDKWGETWFIKKLCQCVTL